MTSQQEFRSDTAVCGEKPAGVHCMVPGLAKFIVKTARCINYHHLPLNNIMLGVCTYRLGIGHTIWYLLSYQP